MKRKTIILFFLTIFFLLLTGCQATQTTTADKSVENLNKAKEQDILSSKNGLSIKLDEKQYTTSDKEVTVHLYNDNDSKVMYSRGFSLEKKINEIWYIIKFKEGHAINDEGYHIPANTSKSETYSLDSLSEKLSEGEYRIIQVLGRTKVATTFNVVKP